MLKQRNAPVWAALWALATAVGCGTEQPATEMLADTGVSAPLGWELTHEELPGALFSVWGTDGDNIWTVGADTGRGPLVLHYNGDVWERKVTGTRGSLWWLSGRRDALWMSGDQGMVLRYDSSTAEFETFTMPGDIEDVTIYGIFPTGDNDVWAVGGRLLPAMGAVYHFDGEEWTVVEDLPASDEEEPFFKVWGRSSDDLWIVGFYGERALHRTASGWENVTMDVETPRSMFTLHGNEDAVYAVGGSSVSGTVVELEGDSFVDVTDPTMFRLNGVHVAENGDVLTAGFAGAIYTRHDGKWTTEDYPITAWSYHGVFVDSSGGQWAVGGETDSEPYGVGIIAHRGAPVGNVIREPKDGG